MPAGSGTLSDWLVLTLKSLPAFSDSVSNCSREYVATWLAAPKIVPEVVAAPELDRVWLRLPPLQPRKLAGPAVPFVLSTQVWSVPVSPVLLNIPFNVRPFWYSVGLITGMLKS